MLSIIDKPSHNTQKEGGKNKVVQKSEPSEETTLSRYLRKVNLLKQEKAKENLKLSEGKGIQKSEDLKEPEVSTKKESLSIIDNDLKHNTQKEGLQNSAKVTDKGKFK